MISLLDFYNVMRHSPLDTFVIYYDNDASFTLMHGETLSEYAGNYQTAYVVEVIPNATYSYIEYSDDEIEASLRVVARMPSFPGRWAWE